MQALDKIKSMVEEGLDLMAKKGELSNSNLDTVDKLTHTLKSIETIQAMKDGYSNGYSNGRRMYSYGDDWGHSNAGENDLANSYGHYSYGMGDNPLADRLRSMLDQAKSERDRRALQDCITKMGG
jgi:hypothetical protein